MKLRSGNRHFVITLLLLTALMIVPQAIFPEYNVAHAGSVRAESQGAEALAVGGWSPAEVHMVINDPVVENASDLPTLKRSISSDPDSAFTKGVSIEGADPDSVFTKGVSIEGADPDSVFIKGVSTVGYDALTKDSQRRYYEALEEEALAFMNAKEDLEPTEIETKSGVSSVYVIAKLDFDDYGIKNYEDASHAYYAFDYDHPAYYWISDSVWSGGDCFYLATVEEYAAVEERARVNSLVDSGVKTYVERAEHGADTLDKIAMIHDQILTDVSYAYQKDGKTSMDTRWAHSVHGVFGPEYRQVVCEGYADAFSLIMNYMGIPNYYILGTENVTFGGHAWNAVSADGGKTYMYMDLTWDDLGKKGYSYENFGMPASDFELLHNKYVPENKRSKWLYPITGNFNDEAGGTYYRQGGFTYDGTGRSVDDIIKIGTTKAGRVGSHVSFMAPARKLKPLMALTKKLGISSNSHITVSYKGTTYYVIIVPVSDHKVDLSAAVLTLSKTDHAYTGGAIEPGAQVTCNGFDLIEGVNYTLSYDNNIETGENAGITATGTGNFTGSARASFTIYPHTHVWTDTLLSWEDDLSKVTATHTCQLEDCGVKTETETAYTTSEVTKEPGCTEEGVLTYTAVFRNQAFGTQTRDVPIKAKGHSITWRASKDATCTEEGNRSYWCCDACGKCFADKDGRSEIDRESITIKALGHEWDEGVITTEPTFTSAGIRTFTCRHDPSHTKTEEIPMLEPESEDKIKLKGTTIKKLIRGRKKITVKWKKQPSQITGYQISYSLKKNFRSGVKTVYIRKKNTVSKEIKNLRSNKRYYFRIRTYKKNNGHNYYSPWSKTKTAKTK